VVSYHWPAQTSPNFLEEKRTFWVDFWQEALFDARLVFPVLAPLGDDVAFMRCVLAFEAGYFAFLRTNMVLGLCADGGRTWHRLPAQKQVLYTIWVVRGCIFIAYSLWAMCRRCPRSLKRWMWFSLVVYALPDAVHYVIAAWIQDVARLGKTLADVLMLLFLSQCGPEAPWCPQAPLRRWMETRGATRAGAAIACLIGHTTPREALEQARRNFRSVDASQLTHEDLKNNACNPVLNDLAQPTKLGHCDAFISHSWHDDPDAKWEALQTWRIHFRDTHGREPWVWFDKCCIDQGNIEEDLRCLPIYLSGCRRLLILCGPTYLSRLWCIIEIFTYIMMGGKPSDIEVELVLRDDNQVAEEEQVAIISAFQRFDASGCRCFDPADKARILSIIETAFGTLAEFNGAVANVLDLVQTGSPVLAQLTIAATCSARRQTTRSQAEENSPKSLGHESP
jgi:hypothetical protein